MNRSTLHSARTIALLALISSLGLGGCSAAEDTALVSSGAPASAQTEAAGAAIEGGAPDTSAPSSVSSGTPAAAAWEALMGPEGEFASAAAYLSVLEKYGSVEPYRTILAQEEMHIQALSRQLNRLGVEVPENPWLGKIPAPANLQTAAQAWADGEVANVAMYDALMDQAADDARLTKVFTNLRRSSQESHLPLFTQAAQGDGTIAAADMPAHEDHQSGHDDAGMGMDSGPGQPERGHREGVQN